MKKTTVRLPGRLLKRAFFEDAPERVAPRLLGKLLVSRTSAGLMAGRIVEVEAYLGPHNPTPDPAAHSHRGPTPRNQVLFGPAGFAYVYSIYGLYYCMNFSCEKEGRGGGVLLRALEPVAGLEQMARNRGLRGLPPISFAAANKMDGAQTREQWRFLRELTGGPGRLCQAMGITREKHNGLDLLDPKSTLQVRDDGMRVTRVLVTRRIGIRHAVELPLRFALPGSECVSGPRKMEGTHIFLRKGGAASGRGG
ncbi:MAG: DNA-3-methyladenine glycosylase [Terracidiphilus sp.]|jgi:DNA-3-methyladenine glycosylase